MLRAKLGKTRSLPVHEELKVWACQDPTRMKA